MFQSSAGLYTIQEHRYPDVEPYNHRVNALEPAVKPIKYHVLAGLAAVHPNCPLQSWDRFLAQMQDTLNMLCTSQYNAKLLAYKEMEGPFDFNKTPMSILGTKGIAYLAPDDWATWQSHGVDEF